MKVYRGFFTMHHTKFLQHLLKVMERARALVEQGMSDVANVLSRKERLDGEMTDAGSVRLGGVGAETVQTPPIVGCYLSWTLHPPPTRFYASFPSRIGPFRVQIRALRPTANPLADTGLVSQFSLSSSRNQPNSAPLLSPTAAR